MKNSKIAKLLAISLSLLLLVGVAVMISATAEDATTAPVVYTEKVGIASINLSYKAQTEMAFAVYDGLEVAEGSKKDVYLLFFNSDPGDISAEELYKKAVARKSAVGTVKLDGVEHLLFYSDGIKANDLAKNIYVCPVVIETVANGGSYTYNYMRGYGMKQAGSDYDYSARVCNPVSYARQKIIDAMAAGVELKAEDALLYSNIISYAAAALAKQGEALVFEEATLVVSGGVIGNAADGASTQTINVKNYPANATVTIRAEAKNAAGEYFLRWEDINGAVVSTKRVSVVPVHSDLGYTVYTAVYGSASESPYAGVVDFENLVVLDGENYVAPGNPIVQPSYEFDSTKAYVNTVADVFSVLNKNGETVRDKVLMVQNRWHYEADASSSNGYKIVGQTLVSLDNDTYASGDKNLTINADTQLGAAYQEIYNTVNANADAVEFDLRINNIFEEGNLSRLQIYGKNSAGASVYQFTLDISVYGNETDGYTVKVGGLKNATSKTVWFNESGNPTAAPVTDASSVKGYKLDSLNDFMLLKVYIDDSGSYPVAYVTINEELVFCGAATKINLDSKGYFATANPTYVANAQSITHIRQHYYTGVGGSITIDNVTYMDK